MSITTEQLERRMLIADDTRKVFHYRKDEGKWYWSDKSEADNTDAWVGPFDKYLDAVNDAVEPYLD